MCDPDYSLGYRLAPEVGPAVEGVAGLCLVLLLRLLSLLLVGPALPRLLQGGAVPVQVRNTLHPFLYNNLCVVRSKTDNPPFRIPNSSGSLSCLAGLLLLLPLPGAGRFAPHPAIAPHHAPNHASVTSLPNPSATQHRTKIILLLWRSKSGENLKACNMQLYRNEKTVVTYLTSGDKFCRFNSVQSM